MKSFVSQQETLTNLQATFSLRIRRTAIWKDSNTKSSVISCLISPSSSFFVILWLKYKAHSLISKQRSD